MPDIENQIIGMLLSEPSRLETAVLNGIQPDMFRDPYLSRLFKILSCYRGREYDTTILTADHPELDVMCLMKLAANADVSGIDFLSYLQALKEQFARRTIAEAADRLKSELNAPPNPDKPDRTTEKILDGFTAETERACSILRGREPKELTDIAKETVRTLEGAEGTRIPFFEEGTEGREMVILRKGQIGVIAAESGTGKTELSLGACVLPSLRAGLRVIYLCTESPANEILGRLCGLYCGLSYSSLLSHTLSPGIYRHFGEHLTDFTKRYKPKLSVIGSDDSIASISAIDSEMRRITNEKGQIDLIVLDYLQDLQPSKNGLSEYEAVSENMQGIKRLTDKYQCATLINSQLNRPENKMIDPEKTKPNKSRLLGSGRIGQIAHLIAFLWLENDRTCHFSSDKTRLLTPFDLILDFKPGKGYISQPAGGQHKYGLEDCPDRRGRR